MLKTRFYGLLLNALCLAVIGLSLTAQSGFSASEQPQMNSHGFDEELSDVLQLGEEVDSALDIHPHDDAHHEEHSGLPQLDVSSFSRQIFWLLVTFAVLYGIFAKKTLPEIANTVETRRDKVEGDLNDADTFKQDAQKVHQEYDDALKGAREKATQIFNDTEDKLKAENNDKLSAFKKRSSDLIAATEESLNKAKQDVMADTHGIAAEIASAAAKKIVGVSTDIKDAQAHVKNIDRKAA